VGSSANAILTIAHETYNGLGFDSNPLFLQAEPAQTVSVTNFMTTEATNIQLSFMMEAFAEVDGSGGSQSAQAFIDPVISIDPSFPDAAAYSVVLSASPASAAEPTSLALLATGLVGLLVRRRNPQAVRSRDRRLPARALPASV
jgi:hypothetical protein